MDNNSGKKSILGLVDAKSNTLKAKIAASSDNLPATVTGTVWYVSNSGDDTNVGNSTDKPWATLGCLAKNADKIKSGDAVLFERGGIYRDEKTSVGGAIRAKGGVYYGAYGVGDKPKLYGSYRDYAEEILWSEYEKNIWTCGDIGKDTGVIVFNHGEKVGYKRFAMSELKQNGDFLSGDDGNLYLYWDKNPALCWDSIEIGIKITLIGLYDYPIENITIENLCFKYSGGHAIAAVNGAKNITVRNCEFGYIGGAILHDSVRYGNAIEFYEACENILVEYNWIYDIYDSGFTHQGGGNYVARNINVNNNLIERCGMGSIEYWLAYGPQHKNYAENVTYADNIMRNAGYCWGGEQRPDKVSSHILSNGRNQNHFINYQIKGNIFDRSSCFLMEITSLDETYPTLSGNLYIQNEGMQLGTFAKSVDVVFNSEVEKVLTEEWGDSEATIIFA